MSGAAGPTGPLSVVVDTGTGAGTSAGAGTGEGVRVPPPPGTSPEEAQYGVFIGHGGDFGLIAKNPDNLVVKWYNKEVEFLEMMRGSCLELAKLYMDLYKRMYRVQTRLRLPAIILSSFTGIASFGQGTFPENYRMPVSITVGIINISIAIIQTYESYLKIGDIVSKSLMAATSLKKLADRIQCETFMPVDDREKSGIDCVREIFAVYQAILDQAPPLRQNEEIMNDAGVNQIRMKIASEFKRNSQYIPNPASASVAGGSFSPPPPMTPPSSPGFFGAGATTTARGPQRRMEL